MNYHIVLSKPFNLEQFNQGAKQGKNPRHLMWDLSQKLNAKVHKTGNDPITFQDRVMAKFFGVLPEQWALARRMVRQLSDDDVVFCNGTDVGLPLAVLCKFAGKHPKFWVHIMVPDNRRVQLILKLFALKAQIDVFSLYGSDKAKLLQSLLNLSPERVCTLPFETDTTFFSPEPHSPGKTHPVIASAGLEKRDYVTLAEATRDLEVDVKICAASCAAKASSGVFPQEVPANMEVRYYDWVELRQLYRNADIVVVPLVDHSYSAGATVVLEAMACRKPVILTSTPGHNEALIAQGVVIGVPIGDAASLREAIVSLLNNPEKAVALAERGYKKVLREHTADHYLELIVSKLVPRSDAVPQETVKTMV